MKKSRAIFLFVVMIIAIAGAVMLYAQLPKKVAALEETVEEHKEATDEELEKNKESVNEVAHTLDKYIAVQHEIQKAQCIRDESQDKRESLMFKILEQLTIE